MLNRVYTIVAMLGIISFVTAGYNNEVFGLEASVGGSATVPGQDIPDAKVCSKTTDCKQVDTPDVEEKTVEEEISVEVGNLDGQ